LLRRKTNPGWDAALETGSGPHHLPPPYHAEDQMPTVQWCWRCQMKVPMLDPREQLRLWRAIDKAHDAKLDVSKVILKEYEQMTGFVETNPNAVYHHITAFYGPPCKACGKPLRTPRAKLCAACMTAV
jgi:hypothetical protein